MTSHEAGEIYRLGKMKLALLSAAVSGLVFRKPDPAWLVGKDPLGTVYPVPDYMTNDVAAPDVVEEVVEVEEPQEQAPVEHPAAKQDDGQSVLERNTVNAEATVTAVEDRLHDIQSRMEKQHEQCDALEGELEIAVDQYNAKQENDVRRAKERKAELKKKRMELQKKLTGVGAKEDAPAGAPAAGPAAAPPTGTPNESKELPPMVRPRFRKDPLLRELYVNLSRCHGVIKQIEHEEEKVICELMLEQELLEGLIDERLERELKDSANGEELDAATGPEAEASAEDVAKPVGDAAAAAPAAAADAAAAAPPAPKAAMFYRYRHHQRYE